MSTYGLWLSAAGMQVNQHRQTVLANNMANAETVGFKRDLAVVMRRQIESQVSGQGSLFRHPVLDGMAGGLDVKPLFHSDEQGSIDRTGRALDVAIDGKGFFEVSDGSNSRYTRDGRFTINSNGKLVLSSGNGVWAVQSEDGSSIFLDRAAGDVQISQGGIVRQHGNVIAKLGLFEPDNHRSLRKVGETLYEHTGDADSMTAADGRIVPGAVESSTVDAMKGIATMIEATRAYQMNATMIQLQDQAIGQATSTVGRLR